MPDNYAMPYFRVLLNDQEIADVLSFIRSGWGNNAPAVTAAEVATIRAATDPTMHDVVVLKMK
jgi:mono/diheme cytochrome c family protein